MDLAWGTVVFGDVVDSRADPTGAGEWLRDLAGRLDRHYGDAALAAFGFTQGDELQGLLRVTADPLAAILLASLDDASRPMRWTITAGRVADGRGPATERSGPAFLEARGAIQRLGRTRDRLAIHTGAPTEDGLLEDLAPLLGQLLEELTDRQRTVARLVLIDELRQAEVAHALDVSRATISVTYGRGHIRSIERLARAIRAIVAGGIAEVTRDAG